MTSFSQYCRWREEQLPDDLSLSHLAGIDLLPPRDDELEALVERDKRRKRRVLPLGLHPATPARARRPTTTRDSRPVVRAGVTRGDGDWCRTPPPQCQSAGIALMMLTVQTPTRMTRPVSTTTFRGALGWFIT